MKKLLTLVLLSLALVAKSFGYAQYYPTRTLNTVFQAVDAGSNTTQLAYSIQLTTHLSVTGGETATVILEISDDGSSAWSEVNRVSATLAGTLVIGLAITDTKIVVLAAGVNQNKYMRLRTVTTGSATAAFVYGNESTFP